MIDEGFPVAEISDHLDTHPDTFVWLDLHDASATDLEVITQEFGLHPLAVEDAVNEHQRPKLDRYEDHLFLSAYAVKLDPATGQVATSEIAAFITPRALITVRKDDGLDPGTLVGRWDASPDLAAHGVGFLVHGLLDQIVDGHFAAVQSLDDEIEELQDELFAETDPGQNLQRRSFELRKSLVLLRRVVLPMREVVDSVMRRDLHLLDDALTPYYQDVYDHVLRATEWTESLRDLVTTILETRLTIQGNRLNEIMRKLTLLGGDHRRSYRGRRLLRPERPLPRFSTVLGLPHQRRPHGRDRRRALSQLQAQEVGLTPRGTTRQRRDQEPVHRARRRTRW